MTSEKTAAGARQKSSITLKCKYSKSREKMEYKKVKLKVLNCFVFFQGLNKEKKIDFFLQNIAEIVKIFTFCIPIELFRYFFQKIQTKLRRKLQ